MHFMHKDKNFALIAEKEGCLEKAGETMKEKMKEKMKAFSGLHCTFSSQ